jgi:ferrous iron transport protein B
MRDWAGVAKGNQDSTELPQSTSPGTPRAGSAAEIPVVALVGNPNTGKTALFNALTGFRRHVANYPGVTVDVARGPVRGTARPMQLLDLPGAYSLAAHSPDEMVLCHALCGCESAGERPAAVLVIVDASNPVRNLYLVSQVLELGLPVVVVLNMIDIARAHGIEIDPDGLSQRLGVPVVPAIATKPDTIGPVRAALERAIDSPPAQAPITYRDVLTDGVAEVHRHGGVDLHPSVAMRVLVDREGYAEKRYFERGGDRRVLADARQSIEDAGADAAVIEIQARYTWAHQVLAGVMERAPRSGGRWTNRIDAVLTHRIAGALLLLLVLYGLFYAIYSGAGPAMDLVEGLLGWVGVQVGNVLPTGWLRSLVVDGVVAGVGGVLVFLPQIIILFLFIAILEDCGYLARAAFMVDRLMRPLGLSGRAFIPLLSSFACAVPAIMGARAIADRRERFITILIAPLMSCSARLPVYVLLIGAIVPAQVWLGGWLRLDALVMLAMYLVGVIVAIPLALVLKSTVLAGPSTGFLMELPSYKMPRLRTVWQRVYLAVRSFVVRAGTVILVVNLVVWALGYFPHRDTIAQEMAAQKAAHDWTQGEYDAALAGAYLQDSYLGRMGKAIEPAIRPLGWDWRIGVGVLASFPAREIIVATLGTICNLGQDAEAGAAPLQDAIRAMRWEQTGAPVFTLPVALSVMVFFALSAQCGATLAVVGKETGSWVWPVGLFLLLTTIAYTAAWIVSATGRAIGL